MVVSFQLSQSSPRRAYSCSASYNFQPLVSPRSSSKLYANSFDKGGKAYFESSSTTALRDPRGVFGTRSATRLKSLQTMSTPPVPSGAFDFDVFLTRCIE